MWVQLQSAEPWSCCRVLFIQDVWKLCMYEVHHIRHCTSFAPQQQTCRVWSGLDGWFWRCVRDTQTDWDSRHSAAGWTCSSLPALWTWWTCPRLVGAPLPGLSPFVSSCSRSPDDDRSASSAGTEEPIRTKIRNTHGCWTFGPNYLFRFCSRCILGIKRVLSVIKLWSFHLTGN